MPGQEQEKELQSGIRPMRLAAWAGILVFLSVGVVLSLPEDIKQSIASGDGLALTLVRSRRYRRYRRASRYRKVKPKSIVKITRLNPQGRIDKKKLRQAIEQKLKRVALCYDNLSKPKASGIKIARKSYRGRSAAAKKKRAKKSNKKSKKGDSLLGTATVAIELNAHGRATSAQLRKSSLPKRYHNCFVWFFRGRKFFPPQGNRSMKLRFSMRLERFSSKKARSARRTRGRRGGKW